MNSHWDVFISHASEDKEVIVTPLTRHLRSLGVSVWLDHDALKIGDSLRQAIDHGLSSSRFAVVILSKAFFAKKWSQRELDALVALEDDGYKRILPIWFDMTADEITNQSPLLAGRLALSASMGIRPIAKEIARIVGALPAKVPQERPPLSLLMAVGKSCELILPSSSPPFLDLLDVIEYEHLNEALAAHDLEIRREYCGDGVDFHFYWDTASASFVETMDDGRRVRCQATERDFALFTLARQRMLTLLADAGIPVPAMTAFLSRGGRKRKRRV